MAKRINNGRTSQISRIADDIDRETVGNPADAMLSAPELAAALQYIRDHKEIWEVILSGGTDVMDVNGRWHAYE